MTIEFETWPLDVIGRLGSLAQSLAAAGVERHVRRLVLAQVASEYESCGIEPDLLAVHADAEVVSVGPSGSGPVGVRSAAVGSGSAVQAFAACLDSRGALWWSPIGQVGPTEWQRVGVQSVELISIAAATSVSPTEGRCFRELFGITVDGRPWHAWQMGGGDWEEDDPDQRWELQADFPADLVSISAGSGGPNHIEVFVANAYGEVHHRWWSRWQDGETGEWSQAWSEWPALPWPEGVQVRDLSFTTEFGAATPWLYQVFAVDGDGRPWHAEFVGEEGAWWGEPSLLPAPPEPLQVITGTCRTQGHLEVFGATRSGQRYSMWSSNWGTDWSEWYRWPDDVPVLTQADGNSFDVDGEAAIHHQLIVDRTGGLLYARFRQADERWRGPFRVISPVKQARSSRLVARAVAEEYRFELALSDVRVFESSFGRPKAELLTPTGSMFLGSLGSGWPSRERLDQVFPLVNDLSGSLEASAQAARLPRYLPAAGHQWIIERVGWRFFVRGYAAGRSPILDRDVTLLATAAAEFHLAAAELDVSNILLDSAAGELTHFALPTLEDYLDARQFAPVASILRFIAEERVHRIDALPRTLTHNDLQPKNVLVEDDSHVWLLDTEGVSSRSRLWDLYFFLLGDDHGAKLGDWSYFDAAVRAFANVAGPLSEEERLLLPNVLAVKAAGVAAWAIETVQTAPADQRGALRDIHHVALGAISFIDRERTRIREAVSG